jgi:hypothetical protein
MNEEVDQFCLLNLQRHVNARIDIVLLTYVNRSSKEVHRAGQLSICSN